ncbi:MAG: SDR family oxidoreductase, partial [Rhodothermia bacterium]|nr:SDR family oxidoreductase [Rhodothermia bacterium]
AVLVPKLIEEGFELTVADTGYYLDGLLYKNGERKAHHLVKDIRRFTEADLEGHDAVVHLAELSNDPLGQHIEENTYDINHKGSVHLANLCKRVGIERFVYTSSCSVYGTEEGDLVKTESSETHPQTAYANCKILVERDVSALADDNFSPTFLRNATAYGPSPRMRFDIVLNNLSGLAWTTKEIRLSSDGTPWRPLVHVADICDAIVCAVNAPREAVHNEIFNVGNTAENYRVREIAEIVADTFEGCELSVGQSDGDSRSYRVNFDKISEKLPGFVCSRDARIGAEQLREIFQRIEMEIDDFEFRAFTRLKQLRHLIETDQIDDRFFWRSRT